ncbi:hypothetical protein INR49_027961 [Caranx melampygus]|nr:hypothetical protein INR49_027961 [Caranx melampygus]
MMPLVFLVLLGEIGQGMLTSVNKTSGVTQDSGVMKALCARESRIYWFRRGASQPMVMDPSARQCTSPSGELSPMQNCTAHLEFDSSSSSDAGMYYCAVASCGEIVFGNGTRVELMDVFPKGTSLMVYFLSVALAVSCIILFALVFSIYKLNKKLCSFCNGSASHLTSDIMSDADTLHYAALSLKRKNGRHRHDSNMETECTYSRVKSRKE